MLKFEILTEVSKKLIEEIKNQKGKFDLNCIRIYPEDKAPEFLKKLYSNDVDWYALVPDDIYDNYYIGFLESNSFGIITYTFPIAGFRVIVGCHS